jgi:hypothetical protein
MLLNPLWPFFHCGDKQNNSHHTTYYKGCVQHYVTDAKLQVSTEINAEAALMEALAEVQEDEQCGCATSGISHLGLSRDFP